MVSYGWRTCWRASRPGRGYMGREGGVVTVCIIKDINWRPMALPRNGWGGGLSPWHRRQRTHRHLWMWYATMRIYMFTCRYKLYPEGNGEKAKTQRRRRLSPVHVIKNQVLGCLNRAHTDFGWVLLPSGRGERKESVCLLISMLGCGMKSNKRSGFAEHLFNRRGG